MSDPIARLNSALQGRYEVLHELGAGGMATVYLAEDLRHERKVALKLLKPELAAVVGAERFLAEITTTAKLQHPHILPLHDSGEADGLLFYVMPYVEGESLRERLDREHQLPVEDAVQIAKNLAEALDYAHRQGVIHRDIKPANVLLLHGKPVIADFGIALAVGAGAMSRMTETGLSLGTPHYMSPEQATGDQNVGPASDTYALGCVLYEMLAGAPLYTGTTPQSILAKIISETPASVTKERRSVPPNVDASIRKACEKLPGDRFTSAHEFAEALSNPGFRYGADTFSTGEARRWRSLGLVGWAATAVLAAVLGWNMLQPEERPVQRSVMGFIPGEQPVSGLNNFAVSPDGTLFGYVGGAPGQIWIKEAENLNARAVPGTEGAWALTFSPDGSQIAFQRGADLLKVSALSGEPPVQLDTGPLSRDLPGLTWLDDDRIVYASSNFELWSVPATGGAPEQLSDRTVEPIGTRALAFPTALPDARGVLFAACTVECRDISLGVLDLRTGEKRELVENSAVGLYAEGGYLVYGRTDGAVYGVQFDLEGLEITGEPRLLVEGLSVELGRASIALSDRGDLVYREPNFDDSGERTLQWVGLDGSEAAVDPDWRAGFQHVSVSPDGQSVAVSIQTRERLDIWTRRLDGSPPVRLTFEGRNRRPTWSADGAFVHFISDRRGSFWEAYRKRADGSAPAELQYSLAERAQDIQEVSASPPWIAFTTHDPLNTNFEVFAARPGEEEPPTPIATAPAPEGNPWISPDGRWIAYASSEGGQSAVYVQRFPEEGDGAKWQISGSEQAGMPAWSGTGRSLFYLEGLPLRMKMTEILPGTTVRVGRTSDLFGLSPYVFEDGMPNYGVAPDGSRLLMIRSGAATAFGVVQRDRLILIENWIAELERSMRE